MKWLVLSILTVMTFSCSMRGSQRRHFSEVTVKIPWQTSPGQYELTNVEIFKINDLYFLNGEYARFVWSPSKEANKMSGQAPATHFFKNKDGIYIPGDELSQQLATIYAHLQHLVEFDKIAGSEGVNDLPIHVGVATQLIKDGKQVYNNAFYDGETDALYFLPFKGHDLQLYINGGIIAHEYFHSLFYKLALLPLRNRGKQNLFIFSDDAQDSEDKPSGNEVESYYNPVFIRGLNEGLADFWAWLYTDDPDFLSRSAALNPDSLFAQEAKRRSLNGSFATSRSFIDAPTIKANIREILEQEPDKPGEFMLGLSYNIGTHFSRILKVIADNWTQDMGKAKAREHISQNLIKATKMFANDMIALKEKSDYSPALFLARLMEASQNLGKSNCELMTKIWKSHKELVGSQFSVDTDKWNCPDLKANEEPPPAPPPTPRETPPQDQSHEETK